MGKTNEILFATKYVVLVETDVLNRLEIWAKDEKHIQHLVNVFYFKDVYPKQVLSIEQTHEKKPMRQWNMVDRGVNRKGIGILRELKDFLEE